MYGYIWLGYAYAIIFDFSFLFQNNQVVGVGSGSTIVYAVDRLGKTCDLILHTPAWSS